MIKGLVLIFVTLLATGIAVWLHEAKGEKTDRMLVTAGLKEIGGRLQSGQSLTLYSAGIPSEIFLYARYALAPRHLVIGDLLKKPDTLLLISEAGFTDSAFSDRQILWEREEGHYHFQLLRRR